MPVQLEPVPEGQKYYSQLSLSPYKRDPANGATGSAFAFVNTTTSLVVKLPLPMDLRDDTTVGYTSVNLETVGDIFNKRDGGDALGAAVLRNAGNMVQAALGGTASGISKVAGSGVANIVAALAGSAAGGGIGIVQGLLPAEQVSSALQQQYGVAPNPNPSVQFQGPVLRDFTLSWAFYPKSKTESDTIFDLIKKLKGRALPSFNVAASGAVLNYPHVCQVNFYPWDGDGAVNPNGWTNKSIIRMGKCFMSGVNVNYHPYGVPSFFEKDSQPVSILLTIAFKEIQYLTSTNWDDITQIDKERDQPTFSAAAALGTLAGTVFGAGAVLVDGFADQLKLFLSETDDQRKEEQTSFTNHFNKVKLPAAGELALVDKHRDPNDQLDSEGNRQIRIYIMSKNAEGKYQLDIEETTFVDGNISGKVILPNPEIYDTPAAAAAGWIALGARGFRS